MLNEEHPKCTYQRRPTSLECQVKVEEGEVLSAMAVCWLTEDKILVGGNRLLQLRDRHLFMLQSFQVKSEIQSIKRVSNDEAIILKVVKTKLKLTLYKFGQRTGKTNLMFMDASEDVVHIGFNNLHLAIIDSITSTLRVFKLEEAKLQELNHITMERVQQPRGCHITSDGEFVLVSCFQNGCLDKYRLLDGAFVWKCEFLHSPTGICQGQNGEIYVAAWEHNHIYQLDVLTGK